MLMFLVGWAGFFVLAAFGTLCLACGLIQLAEAVEEYTVLTKRILRVSITAICAMHLVLGLLSTVPLSASLFGIVTHGLYWALLSSFPFFDLVSPSFLGSVVAFFVQHWLVFGHFAEYWYPFNEIVAYFVLGVWSVPLVLFLSLSANDQVLPTTSGAQPAGFGATVTVNDHKGSGKRHGAFLSVFNLVKDKAESLLPDQSRKGF